MWLQDKCQVVLFYEHVHVNELFREDIWRIFHIIKKDLN